MPERPKGAVCKIAGDAYGGSNPPPPTTDDDERESEWCADAGYPDRIRVMGSHSMRRFAQGIGVVLCVVAVVSCGTRLAGQESFNPSSQAADDPSSTCE